MSRPSLICLRVHLVCFCLGSLASLAASAALAGVNGSNFTCCAVHVVPHGTSCKNLPPLDNCYAINTTYIGTGDVDVIPVFFNLTGYTGIEFGLTWPAEWGSCSFVSCGRGITLGSIVNPGDGITETWSTCQWSWSVAAGHGWLAAYSSGEVALTRSPWGSFGYRIGVVDCSQQFNDLSAAYTARIGWVRGDIPWGCVSESFYPPDATVTDDVPGLCTAVGDTVKYLIVFTNNSWNIAVHNVAILDSLPGGVQYLYGGAYDAQGNVVRWSLGTVRMDPDNQDSVSLAVRISAPAGSVVTQHFIVTGQEFWPFPVTHSRQVCSGPARVQPTTWGSVKAIFR